MIKNIACIVAHPDDEVLAFGGLFAGLSHRSRIYCLTMTDGTGSRSDFNAAMARQRADQFSLVSKFFDFYSWEQLSFQDNGMDKDGILEVSSAIEKWMKRSGCQFDLVLTHWHGDLNQDHRAVSEAVTVACRPGAHYLASGATILQGEVPSSSEWRLRGDDAFSPNVFCGLSREALDKKLNAFRMYTEEVRQIPHPRSIENLESLARIRGAKFGYEFAEAYRLLRGSING